MTTTNEIIKLAAGMLIIKLVFDTFIAPRYSWKNTLKRIIESKSDPAKQVKMNREELYMVIVPIVLMIVADVYFYLTFKIEASKILILYPKIFEVPVLTFVMYRTYRDIKEHQDEARLSAVPAIRNYYGI